jgi:Protein of unknown function (DUF2809)
MLTFDRKYFFATLLLFLIEVFIGVFVHDSFIRPFIGDMFIVIFIYCFVQSFWKTNPKLLLIQIFIFACVVEGLQYLNIVDKLGIRQNKLLVIILGSSFDWGDILAYALGCGIVLWYENRYRKK